MNDFGHFASFCRVGAKRLNFRREHHHHQNESPLPHVLGKKATETMAQRRVNAEEWQAWMKQAGELNGSLGKRLEADELNLSSLQEKLRSMGDDQRANIRHTPVHALIGLSGARIHGHMLECARNVLPAMQTQSAPSGRPFPWTRHRSHS